MSRAPAVAGKRRPQDAYPTPPWVTRRLLEVLAPLLPANPRIFEPAAGRGHIVREIRRALSGANITAWELDWNAELMRSLSLAERLRMRIGDSLAAEWSRADAIIMNPPFSLASDFVTKALAAAPIVAVLERISWLCPSEDRQWLRGRAPSVLVLPNRPSFAHVCKWGPGKADYTLVPFDQPSPEGTTSRLASSDAAGYAWFVWEPSNAAKVMILPDTSLAERREGSWVADKAAA
jgi:hypothetical protein